MMPFLSQCGTLSHWTRILVDVVSFSFNPSGKLLGTKKKNTVTLKLGDLQKSTEPCDTNLSSTVFQAHQTGSKPTSMQNST